ncbi:MAG: hypothetical protein ABI772_02245 [Bacteroidota bacterium]
MKTKLLCVALFVAVSIQSCKKDEDTKPSEGGTVPVIDHTIAGKWVGKYGYGNDNPDIYYCFQINANGTLKELHSDGVQSGTGTWTLTTTTFSAYTQFLPPLSTACRVNGTLNESTMRITGTWGYSPSVSNGGKFYLQKQ